MFRSIFKQKYYRKKTFTFYIPAPPLRKTGYQEREFDAAIEYIASLNFDIIDFKIQSHSSEQRSGLWVLCILGAKTKKIYNTQIDFDYSSIPKSSNASPCEFPLDPQIIHDN